MQKKINKKKTKKKKRLMFVKQKELIRIKIYMKDKKDVLVYMEIHVRMNTYVQIGIIDLKLLKKIWGKDVKIVTCFFHEFKKLIHSSFFNIKKKF